MKYIREATILAAQLFMFYIFPLFAGPTDAIGMVLLILISVFVLAVLFGSLIRTRVRYVYPAVVAILFIPSVFIYYNESALVHALWYLVVSSVGLIAGMMLRWIFCKLANKRRFE